MEARNTTIEDLPASILVHILSFVPITYAIRASAVGPQWRNLWHSVPILDFDINEFQRDRCPDKSLDDVRQLFAEMITQTLFNRPRNFSLEKFRLTYTYLNYKSPKSCLNTWIRYAIACKVKEICIDHDVSLTSQDSDDEEDEDLEKPEVNKRYRFDFTDLIKSSVTSLTMYGCEFHLSKTLASSIKIPCLRQFHLWSEVPEVRVTDEDVSNLMSACVNLESLTLSTTWGYKNLKIVSPKLKELRLHDYVRSDDFQDSVEICAPSLQFIELVQFDMGKYIVEDTSSLIEAHVEFNTGRKCEFVAQWTNIVRLLRGVERLAIQNMWMCKVYLLLLLQVSVEITHIIVTEIHRVRNKHQRFSCLFK